MAVHYVQEAILFAETVPWMTIASQAPYVEQVLSPHRCAAVISFLNIAT